MDQPQVYLGRLLQLLEATLVLELLVKGGESFVELVSVVTNSLSLVIAWSASSSVAASSTQEGSLGAWEISLL